MCHPARRKREKKKKADGAHDADATTTTAAKTTTKAKAKTKTKGKGKTKAAQDTEEDFGVARTEADTATTKKERPTPSDLVPARSFDNAWDKPTLDKHGKLKARSIRRKNPLFDFEGNRTGRCPYGTSVPCVPFVRHMV